MAPPLKIPATGCKASVPAWLGAGVGYRRSYRAALLDSAATPEALPQVIEIMPDHFIGDSGATTDTLLPLAQRYHVVFHDVGLSLGSADDGALMMQRLERVAALATLARPIMFTEHLALTRSPAGLDAGHLVPLLLTHELLDVVSSRVVTVQATLGIPVALENIAAPFALRGGDYTEAEFFTELVARTGCGMLLDVVNLLYTARNQQLAPVALLQSYPLDAVMQLHLAGGVVQADYWVDSHSQPVEPASFALLAELRGACPKLRTVVVERDSNFGVLADVLAQAQHAVALLHAAPAETRAS